MISTRKAVLLHPLINIFFTLLTLKPFYTLMYILKHHFEFYGNIVISPLFFNFFFFTLFQPLYIVFNITWLYTTCLSYTLHEVISYSYFGYTLRAGQTLNEITQRFSESPLWELLASWQEMTLPTPLVNPWTCKVNTWLLFGIHLPNSYLPQAS